MKPIMIKAPTHVDDFIDDFDTNKYASWVLNLHRLPAALKLKFKEYIDKYKLFCTYKGERYRVVGCSRMGDVWLNDTNWKEGNQPHYKHRVSVDDCSNWSGSV